MCLTKFINHHPFLSLIRILIILFPPWFSCQEICEAVLHNRFNWSVLVNKTDLNILGSTSWLSSFPRLFIFFKLSLDIQLHLCKWDHPVAAKSEVWVSISYLTAYFYLNKWYTMSILNLILTEVVGFWDCQPSVSTSALAVELDLCPLIAFSLT